jgi:hypothetical protein
MKINLEIDLTPIEFRQIFGLPDVQPLQEEIMNTLREKMLASVENYDPMNFLAPFLPEGMRSMEDLQRAWREVLAGRAKQKKQE